MKNRIFLFALVILCSCSQSESVSPDTGKSGSLARFAIVGNYLYVVSDQDLKSFDISTPNAPQLVANTHIGWNIETIFPIHNYLLFGSNNGVYLYEIGTTGTVLYKSFYRHFSGCDPVVAANNYAYSTVRTGQIADLVDTINELHIINISNIDAPIQESVVRMTHPLGLGIDGNHLFVCDAEGIRILDVSDKAHPRELNYLKGVDARDVIVLGNQQLIVIGQYKLTQLSYQNILQPTILSVLNLK